VLMHSTQSLPLNKRVKHFTLASVGVLALLLLRMVTPLAARQVVVMPGSVIQGERLLEDKGCLRCHAINGRGGDRAPDFARPAARARTPDLFASVMWNHSPRMRAEFELQERPVPALGSAEVADLFAYFYSTLYFSPQGSATQGLKVFQEKGCISCHPGVLDTRRQKSVVEKWTLPKDPATWAEQMWNHAGEMDSATTNRGSRWQRLSEQDIVDLLLFLGKLPETQIASLNAGEPQLGRIVFERYCETCHSFDGADKSKVNLLVTPRPLSITGYIAAMWNHALQMRRRAGSLPRLNSGDMPNLITFLFSQRLFLARGNVAKGRRVFEEKGCAKCHEAHREETGASDLSQVTEVFSPITLTSAAWRHGPAMLEKMKEQNIPWPEFKGPEMTNLITYLNSRLVIRIAKGSAATAY
jgi:cytochrome c2